jgi:hypothetical protein
MEVMNSVETANESVQNAVRGNNLIAPSGGGAGIGLPRNNRGRITPAAEGKDDEESDRDRDVSVVMSNKRRGSHTSSSAKQQQSAAEDIKAVQELEDRFPLVSISEAKQQPHQSAVQSNASANDDDDELEATLDNWLEKNRCTNVTMRRRGGGAGAIVNLMDDQEDMMIAEEDGIGMYSTATKTINRFQPQVADDYASEGFDEYGESFDIDRPLRGQVMGDDVEVVGMQCMLAKALMGEDDDDQEDDYDSRSNHK